MRKAHAEALATYEAVMNAAVEQFTREIAAGVAQPSARASVCWPGDPFCTSARND